MIIRISFDVENVIKIHDDIIEKYMFKVEKEEVIEFLLQLAKGEIGLKEVKKWIKKKVKSK